MNEAPSFFFVKVSCFSHIFGNPKNQESLKLIENYRIKEFSMLNVGFHKKF